MTARLTDLAVTRLTPSDRRREIPDGGCPGLFLQLQPSGAKSWALRCRIGGRPVKITLGGFPVLGVRDARERAREALALVDRGVDPRAEAARLREEKAAADASTLRAIAERFRDQRMKAARPATWRDSWAGLDRYVLTGLGSRPIESIRRSHLLAILDGLQKRPGAQHHVANALGSLFRWAVDRELIEANPAIRLPRPKLGVRSRVLTDAEIPIVWRAAERVGYPYGRLVQLALLTACRRGELANMTWGEVDAAAGLITLPRERTKTGKAHVVPTPPMAREILEAVPRLDGPFLFSTRGGRAPISGFSKMHVRFEATLTGQCETEGVTPFTVDLHDLRRTVRTGLSALRVAPHVAESVLGHVIGGVERHYNFYDFLDEKRAALEAWARHVGWLIDPAAPANVVSMRR